METTMDGEERQARVLPMVHPGEQAVLFSHREYVDARKLGRGLDDYRIVMRQPDDAVPEGDNPSEEERWIAVAANKYLKHRAMGWREAESLDELPERWFYQAEAQAAFHPAREETGEEAEDAAS